MKEFLKFLFGKNLVFVILLFVYSFLLVKGLWDKDRLYNTKLAKYQKQINELISKQMLQDDRATNLQIALRDRELLISTLTTKLGKGNKVDTVYSLSKYKLSPYARIDYTIKVIDTLGVVIITPNIRVSDYGFIFAPNLSLLFYKEVAPALFATVWHYKNFGVEAGVSYSKQDGVFINGGINYIFWSNTMIKVGGCTNIDLEKYLYIGIGCNL